MPNADNFLVEEKIRAREANRPVYRFGLDYYECPFCGWKSRDETLVNEHIQAYCAE